MSTELYLTTGFATLAILLATYWALTNRSSLPSYIPGPPSPSWIAGEISYSARVSFNREADPNLGNAVQIVNDQEKAGDLEFAWFKRYGATIKIKGTFGVRKTYSEYMQRDC